MQKKNLTTQVKKDKYFQKKLVNNDYTLCPMLEMQEHKIYLMKV